MMRFPMAVLRVATLGPALLVSFVLTVMVCALLPPMLGLLLFLAAAAALVALARGQLEEEAIAALTGSHPATAAEAAAMAPALVELGSRGLDIGAVFVRRAQRPDTPVALAIAGRAVVVTPGLVESAYRGGVTVAEVAAVLAHAVGRRRAIMPRLELAVLAATSPWRLVVGAFRGVGRAFAWLPFMRLAWTLRGVVGVICVVQSMAENRAAPGLLGGAVIVLSYLVPAAAQIIERRTENAADQLVLELGLGGALAGLLRRYGHPMSIERVRRLEAAVEPPPRTRLHLVHG